MQEQLDYCVPRGIPHSTFLDWLELDQDKAIEWQRLQLEKCSSCGTRSAEWARDRFAFVAHTSRCPGCEVIEMEQANIPDKAKGVRVGLMPRALADKMEEPDGVS